MVGFWLYDPLSLFSLENFTILSTDSKADKVNKILNIISLIVIIIGVGLSLLRKNTIYFGITIVLLSLIILIQSNIKVDSFETVSNGFNNGVRLLRVDKNKLYINQELDFKKGDIISLQDINNPRRMENHVISDVKYTTDTNSPVLILMNNVKGNFYGPTTNILKVSDSTPNIIPPPDGNVSIEDAGNYPADPNYVSSFPKYTLPNGGRYDWNLELSTMIPPDKPSYKYQGQPYGPLNQRGPSINNPMGNVNVTEYDENPTFFGTVSVDDSTNGVNNGTLMTENQEATLSMRVDDLLFHKGNSQGRFTPLPVDTVPNNQEAFAHFCYRNPTNLVNPKYASIFVNDPEKFKIVAALAKATGTENGGGGGP